MHFAVGRNGKMILLYTLEGEKVIQVNLLFGEQAKLLAGLLTDAADQSENDSVHPYFQTMKTPKVQVVVASTNDNLLPSIEAWEKQDYPDYQVLFVIDCITEESKDIIHKYKSNKISFLTSPNLQGLVRVYNYGLQSDSQYVSTATSDSIPSPSYLSNMISKLEEYPECGFVTPNPDVVWWQVITKDCIERVGLLRTKFGLTGIAPWYDWRIRARKAGFQPRAVNGVSVDTANSTSLLDKGNTHNPRLILSEHSENELTNEERNIYDTI